MIIFGPKPGSSLLRVDRIIRVGGSSAIPCMKALLDDVIGESKVWSNANLSTSIAEGAAMYAAYLDNRDFFDKDIAIYTRTCHALGIKTVRRQGRNFKELIPANHRTPCEVKQVFTTYQDNVPFFDIDIYARCWPGHQTRYPFSHRDHLHHRFTSQAGRTIGCGSDIQNRRGTNAVSYCGSRRTEEICDPQLYITSALGQKFLVLRKSLAGVALSDNSDLSDKVRQVLLVRTSVPEHQYDEYARNFSFALRMIYKGVVMFVVLPSGSPLKRGLRTHAS